LHAFSDTISNSSAILQCGWRGSISACPPSRSRQPRHEHDTTYYLTVCHVDRSPLREQTKETGVAQIRAIVCCSSSSANFFVLLLVYSLLFSNTRACLSGCFPSSFPVSSCFRVRIRVRSKKHTVRYNTRAYKFPLLPSRLSRAWFGPARLGSAPLGTSHQIHGSGLFLVANLFFSGRAVRAFWFWFVLFFPFG